MRKVRQSLTQPPEATVSVLFYIILEKAVGAAR